MRADELQEQLRRRARDVARAQAALAAFTIAYRQQVGLLHDELDDLERAVAEAELGEVERDPARWKTSADASGDAARRDPPPRYTTDAVRKLFRDVAKAIHPDLAEDDATRERRHSLMVEANRAYSLGDEDRLRRILESWQRNPDAIREGDDESSKIRLLRRIEELEEQIAAVTQDLEATKDTPMWKLKTMVDEASARGSDLMRDMVRRLKHDILVARNRLDAIRSTS